ncbi:MAG: bifunctional pyr operon transcriptional regulator/uracil phosphoribosyltransferase PyrR [Fibrobacterota bacterium]|nr:bifunctional pyr operon transcriptional regulator/uracil phosphoribosyltransferase PyrR [Chitinispirillaceae bacterium]
MKKLELLMDSQAIDLALTRIAHQVLEKNRDFSRFGVVGMQTRGVFLASRITNKINELAKTNIQCGTLDATFYRDDYRISLRQPEVKVTDIPFDVNNMNLLLVDDVFYTGRTIRAALDALMDYGRPKTIQLAVLIDRGNRELPIRADYVGKKITTLANQVVSLKVHEKDNEDSMWLMELEDGE